MINANSVVMQWIGNARKSAVLAIVGEIGANVAAKRKTLSEKKRIDKITDEIQVALLPIKTITLLQIGIEKAADKK